MNTTQKMPRYGANAGLATVAAQTVKSPTPNQDTTKGPARGTTISNPKAAKVPMAKAPVAMTKGPLKKAPVGKPESNRGAMQKQIDVENKTVNTFGMPGTTGKQKMPRYK